MKSVLVKCVDMVVLSFLANINGTQLDDTSEDEYDYDYRWTHGHTNSHGRDHLDWSRDEGLRCGCTRSSSSLYPLRYYEDARDCPLLSSWKVQAKESVSLFLFGHTC